MQVNHQAKGIVSKAASVEQPLLTIAVPTYNRVCSLERALQRILAYAQDYPVEILVSDNASTDGTETFMSDFVQQHPQVRYYRKPVNTGFGGNFINCVNLARGKYLLIHSDDDILLSGGLEALLLALKQEPVFVYLNWMEIAKVQQNSPAVSCTEKDLLTFTNKNAFLDHVGMGLTFISTLVFCMEYVRELEDKEALVTNDLAQVYIVFRTMRHKGKYIVVRKPCIAAYPSNDSSYDRYRVWVDEYAKLLLQEAPACGFDARLCERSLHEDISRNVLRCLVHAAIAKPEWEAKWDRSCVLPTVARFPDLVPVYQLLLETPASERPQLKHRIVAMKEDTIVKACKGHAVYIYGGGTIGQHIAEVLHKHQVAVQAIVVTEQPNGAQAYRGIPILPLQQVYSDIQKNADAFIILAMKREYQTEVQDMLLAKSVQPDKIYRQIAW